MSRFTVIVVLGLLLGSAASADQSSSQEKRTAECTQRANDRQMVNRQEFVDFCMMHNDAEVQRYWDCAPRADKRDLGTDTRSSFLDWCVKQEKFDAGQADRFSECNARAAQQDLKGDTREEFVAKCVRHGD